MKKLLLALVLSVVSVAAHAEPKYLHYKFNDDVTITISNVECPLPKVQEQYQWAVIARRSDGASLIGCFKKQDENMIEIQWWKGDKTVLPANVFLVDPDKGVSVKPSAKRTEI